MDEDIKSNDATEASGEALRRAFLKGVICIGAAALSAGRSVTRR
jgi:hypothetical protein